MIEQWKKELEAYNDELDELDYGDMPAIQRVLSEEERQCGQITRLLGRSTRPA